MTEWDQALRDHPDLDKEKGSALDWRDSMFTAFDGGAVFDLEEYKARDVEEMFKKDFKSRQIEALLTLPHRRATGFFEAPKDDRGQTEWLNEQVALSPENGGMKIPVEDVIGQMTSARSFRRAYFEKVFKQAADGKVTYDKIAWRPASTCRMRRDKKNGSFDGFEQDPINPNLKNKQGMDPVIIKKHRAFVYINGRHRDPVAGVSDMDIPFWCYTTKRKILFLWFQFLEQTSLPRIMVTAPEQGIANEVAKQMAGMRASGILPVASGGGGANQVTAQVLDSSGKGADQFLQALGYLDSAASSSALVGFSDLASAATNGRGSNSLHISAADFFLQQEEAVSLEMATALTHHVWAPLVKWNFGSDATVPAYRFRPLEESDMTQVTSLLSSVLVAPKLNVPDEFVQMLSEVMANHLNLDVDKLTAAFEGAAFKAQKAAAIVSAAGAAPAGQGAARVAGAVGAATRVAQASTARG